MMKKTLFIAFAVLLALPLITAEQIQGLSFSSDYNPAGKTIYLHFSKEGPVNSAMSYTITNGQGIAASGNFSISGSADVSARLEEGSYALNVRENETGNESWFDIVAARQENMLKSCASLGGDACTLGEKCESSYQESKEGPFCCKSRCLSADAKEGNPVGIKIDLNLALYAIAAACIIFIAAGMLIRQSKQKRGYDENGG